jgi:hypothetical protein
VFREERLTENQQTFRYANERLVERLAAAGTQDHRHVPFFCECADESCSDRVNATLDEFEEAHVTSNHYFILPGHARIEAEEAIEENGRYDVVVKG